MKHLVLLSGGLDSTTVLATVHNSSFNKAEDDIVALSFHYGQRHEWELDKAAKIAEHYDIEHHVEHINQSIFRGPKNQGLLIDHKQEMPDKRYSELEGVSPSYVPFRNGIFWSVAAAFATTHECDIIHVGVHAEDAANWAYPDCTPEFVGSMVSAIYIGTYHKVRMQAPLQYLLKADVVAVGLELEAPYELTRSCYANTELSCGRCPTCYSRLDAFKANAVKDPIEYDCKPLSKMTTEEVQHVHNS